LEETGLSIKNIRFGAVTNDIFEQENKHHVTIWMLSDYDSGEVETKEPVKFMQMDWFDFDRRPTPLFVPWNQLLKSEFINKIKRPNH
jgi:8-oxo-dGTP diphosphatase